MTVWRFNFDVTTESVNDVLTPVRFEMAKDALDAIRLAIPPEKKRYVTVRFPEIYWHLHRANCAHCIKHTRE